MSLVLFGFESCGLDKMVGVDGENDVGKSVNG